jgi:hypothetical protein
MARPRRPRTCPQPHARRGNYAVLFGVSLTALLGMGALAIDTAMLSYAELQSQAIADAGAHAALVQLRENGSVDDARTLATQVVNANQLMGHSAQVEAEDIVFGTWDYDARAFEAEGEWINSVQVTIRKTEDSANGPVATTLMKMFGVQYNEIEATSPSIGALRFREIIVVQDVTGSFSEEIELAKDADLTLLNYLADNPQPGDRLGMVTFVGDAELWTPLMYVEDEYDAIYSQWETLDWCDRSYYPWYYYGAPYYHPVPQMMGCNTGSPAATWYNDSGTNQGSGLELAVDTLLDSSADSHALKTIILVSDGRPQCIPSDAACDAAVALEGLDAADYAADNNISIYSVSFNETYDADQSAYMESLTRGYGFFRETPDPEELPAILEDIAASIPIALVK